MAPSNITNGVNGHALPSLAVLDPSKLTVTLTTKPKALPPPEALIFGQNMTDHMLIAHYDPISGWSAPSIQPYGPLTLDPASSCFQYCPSVFEGMKAFLGPDGKPRLFRPELNMERMVKSAARVALPLFDGRALLTLIKKLVAVEQRWIPQQPGYSLYIRPTLIGTRPALGVAPSEHAILYVILSPTGPYFSSSISASISLLASYDNVRSWPGGTGAFKLGLNYGGCFQPQQVAGAKGYQQVLWLLGEDRHITEAGQMNFFAVIRRDDGDLDLVTPPLDGTILPGITRASVLELAEEHSSNSCLDLPETVKLYPQERVITMPELFSLHAQGNLLEAFGSGTAAIIAAVGKIGFDGKDLILPQHEGGLGPVGKAMWKALVSRMEGRTNSNWSVVCE